MPSPPSESSLSRAVLVILALACGVTVANVYFAQAVTPLIADELHVSPNSAALVAVAAQVGYGVGIFFLVPLGDRVSPRPLIVILLALTGLELFAASRATALPMLIAASAVVSITTVVPQILIPMAAGLVPDYRRGAVVGALLAGLLGGILLARTFSGTLGGWLGWRAPYSVAAAVSLALAVILAFVVPRTTPPSRQSYPSLLAASLQLFRTEPALRRSCLYQAMLFGSFSAAWTSLALLITGPTYHLGTNVVGLIALVGAGSVVAAPAAGRWVDRRGPDVINLVCIVAMIAVAGVLTAGALGGVAGIVALAAGMLMLDIAVQCSQVANQARIFALRAEVRSRLNTAYMTCTFIGGSTGSWLGVRAFTHAGWIGVCVLIAIAAALALTRYLVRSPQRDTNTAPQSTASC